MNINNYVNFLAAHGWWGFGVIVLVVVLTLGRRWMTDIFSQRNYRLAMKHDELASRHRIATGGPPPLSDPPSRLSQPGSPEVKPERISSPCRWYRQQLRRHRCRRRERNP